MIAHIRHIRYRKKVFLCSMLIYNVTQMFQNINEAILVHAIFEEIKFIVYKIWLVTRLTPVMYWLGCTYMCSKCLTKCVYACHLLKNTGTATVPLISNDSY